MALLKAALVCLVLAALSFVLVPFAAAHLLGAVFLLLFLVLLFAGVAQAERMSA